MTSQSGPQVGLGRLFMIFLGLGLRGFGGPMAHMAMFREEFVSKRRWLSDEAYAERLALCNFMPGPSSSQMGMAIGYGVGGFWGLCAAFLGFTLPSAVLMTAFAYGLTVVDVLQSPGVLLGIKLSVVAIVAHALMGMARSLCPDARRAAIAAAAMAAMIVVPDVRMQFAVLAVGALLGLVFLPYTAPVEDAPSEEHSVRRLILPISCLVGFFALLVGLPVAARFTEVPLIDLFTVFYRVGSLVFGGGHVVLPLLEAETVARGWVAWDPFVAGYGAAQAVPGPMFTFAAYLGALAAPGAAGALGVAGAAVAVLGIFAPSFFLVSGILPLWPLLRTQNIIRRLLLGLNAAVVGLLAAVLYSPVITSAVSAAVPALLAVQAGVVCVLFGLLWLGKMPSWAVLALGLAAGVALETLDAA